MIFFHRSSSFVPYCFTGFPFKDSAHLCLKLYRLKYLQCVNHLIVFNLHKIISVYSRTTQTDCYATPKLIVHFQNC